MDVLIYVVCAIVLLLTWWYLYLHKFYRHLKKFKGPYPYPFVGSAFDFLSTKEILPRFLQYQRQYGDLIKIMIGPYPPLLLITDCDFLKYLLNSAQLIDKADDYRFLHRWLGTGLLTGTGDKWRMHRKMLIPTFHMAILDGFSEVLDSACDILIGKLKREVGKESFDIYPYVTLCSLDVICETSMGTSVNAQSDSGSDYAYRVKEMCRIVIERSTSIIKSNDFLYSFSKDSKKEHEAIKILHDYTKSVIRKRKEELIKKNSEVADDSGGTRKRLTLLDLLLTINVRDSRLITEEEIREEVDTFMFAGHDTTSSAISFTLFCIANHQDVQDKIMEELKNIFENDSVRPASCAELKEMKYLEAVIKESLRLYPPVPIYARNVAQDTEYDGGVLPKDMTLGVFAYGLHRKPELFPDPERFDPERFANGQVSPFAYIPFSAGPRSCIGQKFAMLELKAVISKLLRNYRLSASNPEHELQLVAETVLKSTNGVRLRIHPRS